MAVKKALSTPGFVTTRYYHHAMRRLISAG
jgi:hypothetical protein